MSEAIWRQLDRELFYAASSVSIRWFNRFSDLRARGVPPVAAEVMATEAVKSDLLGDMWREHFPALKPTPAAEKIATDIARYQASSWQRERHGGCPHPKGSMNHKIWHVLSLDTSGLSSRTIVDLLKMQK